jgi:hypothetical protein
MSNVIARGNLDMWLTSCFAGSALESNGHVHGIADRTTFGLPSLPTFFYSDAVSDEREICLVGHQNARIHEHTVFITIGCD